LETAGQVVLLLPGYRAQTVRIQSLENILPSEVVAVALMEQVLEPV
jgi:hypothetical protein